MHCVFGVHSAMSQPSNQNPKKMKEIFENNVKQHEDNLKYLHSQAHHLDDRILDLQVSLGRYHSTNVANYGNGTGEFDSEEETIAQILNKETTAAGIFCQVKSHHTTQALNLALAKDVIGVVSTLAWVNDDNLSRIFSEFLGLENMLAIVCSSYEGMKPLEKYDGNGIINGNSGLHGLASSIGRRITGRYLVFCLSALRPYVGEFVADDPQRKLDIPKPKLQNGECPPGFVDYAVNMINLDNKHLSCLTASGHGLRETLFYYLFSHLQVYKTREDMLLAFPCIYDGALSLDGGMIKKSGVFALGSRKEPEVKFPVHSGKSGVPANYIHAEEAIRMLKWERSNIAADILREQQLLELAKAKAKR